MASATVSLHEQYVTGGKDVNNPTEIPALSRKRKKNINFIVYQAPPSNANNKAIVEEWLERASFIEEDLHQLLCLPHDRFWCQVVFDNTLQKCVNSYLSNAPRSHDFKHVKSALPADVQAKQDSLHRLFFFACVRMATHKESKEHFIEPSVFGEIIYENFIFDVPKLMDICALYGGDNKPLVGKLVFNIFTQQPKYHDDVKATIPTLVQILDTVCSKCGIRLEEPMAQPVKLRGDKSKQPALVTMAIKDFEDLVFYLYDVAFTLSVFLDVYPNAAGDFNPVESFPIKLASFYEVVAQNFPTAFRERDWTDATLRSVLWPAVHQTQVCILEVFHQILFHSCLQPLLEGSSDDIVADRVERYLHVVTSVLAEKRFLAHLQHLHPFREDRELLTQSSYKVDETALQYIEAAIVDAILLHGKPMRKPNSNPVRSSGGATNIPASKETADAFDFETEQSDNDYDAQGACAARVTGVELESLISSVKDLLPELGAGFVKLCLEEYGHDVEKVINAIFEDKLHPSLRALDRALGLEDDKKRVPEPQLLLQERRNIYDNDQFDVFSHDVDMQNIHKGKKERLPKMADLLDDKSDLMALKPLFQKYGSEFVEDMYAKNVDYDDEYDDTYDSNVVGAGDADSADELTVRRPFVIPRVLRVAENADDDEGEEPQSDDRRRDDFVEDPAKLRAIQEQRWAARQERFGRGRASPATATTSHESPKEGAPPKTYDVKGVAKGHGQSAEVLKNRAWKEKNKGSRVHHNRKDLADRKRRV